MDFSYSDEQLMLQDVARRIAKEKIAPSAEHFDATGEYPLENIRLLGENGLLVSFGSMTGESMQIPSGELIFKQITVKGFWGTPASKALSAQDRRRLMGELLQRAASGELQLPVAATYGVDAIGDAIRDSLVPGRASKGKILLRP